MERRVKRSEVNIIVGSKSPAKSPLKEGQFPNAEALAQKYGIMEVAEPVQPPPKPIMQTSNREIELLRKLEDKNRRIDQLCTLLEALEPAPGVDAERIQKLLDDGVDENVDFRDAKIVSLAKKSHRLTMQLNKEKSVADKLNQQVADLQKSIASLQQELTTAKASSSKSEGVSKVYNRNAGTSEPSAEEHAAAMVGLQRDLKESGKQVEELKRKLTQSVEENKQLGRVLAKELGEGVTLDQAVSDGWKGRAQQIIMLKAKIKKLEAGEASARTASSGYGQGQGLGPGAGSQGTVNVDRKAEEDLVAMSADRRQIVEALTAERAGLMESHQQLERKNHAQKARIHNLEGEVRKLKDSLQVVLDKSGTDDQLLDALREELGRLKGQLQQTQQQQAHRQAAASMAGPFSEAGRTGGDGISTRFSMAGSTAVGQSQGQGQGQGRGSSGGGSRVRDAAGSATGMLADSLDFLQMQQMQQEEALEGEVRHLQAEVARLRRLCKNQAEQLETQDGTIRQLKKRLNTDYSG